MAEGQGIKNQMMIFLSRVKLQTRIKNAEDYEIQITGETTGHNQKCVECDFTTLCPKYIKRHTVKQMGQCQGT